MTDGEAMDGPGDDQSDDLPRDPQQVRRVYDEIATHFSKTREYPWPETENFLSHVDGGPVGLDVGCGNGRNLSLLAERCRTVVGVDISNGLLREAEDRTDTEGVEAKLVQGDAASLPIASDTVALCISVATIHHLPDRDSRVEGLREIGRVLDADGQALVSTWSTAHDRFDADSDADVGFDTTVDWTLPGGETRPRFYHIYAPAEFEADLTRAGLHVDDSYVSSGNCYAEITG